ncbi:MAG: helicase-associated domain-containing protein [Anaerolineae bacterium]|nr:helicase C-terminal domain-containing protein [Candidatus Roseilinea sp.]MDW8449258.1 helicase-associated domain-containing protein [Anaerolineae bacterium]
MARATDLLDDIFTFLCFLHANDVRPRGTRFLPPRALAALNAQLRMPDEGSIRGERDAPRICFIHFLCEAAQFVTRVGDVLKPSVFVPAWLSAAPEARWQPLVRVLRSDDPAIDALWRAYHLPGWRCDPPRAALRAMMQALHSPGRHTLASVAGKLPMTLHDAPDAQPQAVARALARCLEWLGWAEVRRGRIALTDVGRRCLTDEYPATPPRQTPARKAPALTIGRDGDLLADRDAPWTTLYELCAYADLIAVHPQRCYRLSESRVRRALARGATAQQIIGALEGMTGDALPPAIGDAIHAWAGAFGRLRVYRAALIEARDAQLWADLLRQRGIRACVRPLSARAAAIKPGKVRALIRRLERRGVPAQVTLAPSPDAPHPRQRTALAQLYLAVRLCHRLAGAIPSHLLPPYALALDLERQIEPLEVEAVAALVETVTGSADDEEAERADPDDVLNAAAAALAERGAMDIRYRGRGDRVAAWRRIEPRRLEWHSGIAYVVAWCHRAQAERMFRADRILEINRSNTTPAPAPPADDRSSQSS